MADLSWLRLGPRSRTPNAPRSPASCERAPARDAQLADHRKPDLSSHSPVSPEHLSGGSGLLIREQDRIWHNPSLDQMVEALQVAVVSGGILNPIPVEYNAYVLHLVEGFAASRDKIRVADAAHAGAKQSLEQNLEEFRSLVDDWLERERQYKAEIKRLEVLLSRTSREGLEAVTLARTNSVVDRIGPGAKEFISRLARLSLHRKEDMPRERCSKPCGKPNPTAVLEPPRVTPWETSQRTLKPIDDVESGGSSEHSGASAARNLPTTKVALPKILDKDNDTMISEKLERLDAAARASARARQYPKGRRRHRVWRSTKEAGNDSSATKLKVASAETDVFIQEPRPLFSDDSLAPTSSGGRYARRQMLESLLGQDDNTASQRQNLAQSPGSSDPATPRESPKQPERDFRHQRGFSSFSFVPGDDMFPPTTGRMTEDGDEAKRGRADNIELRSSEQVPRQRAGGDVQGLLATENRSYTEPTAILAPSMGFRGTRGSRATQKDGPGTHGSSSSVNTVVRGVQGRPSNNDHEPRLSRHEARTTTPGQGRPGPGSGASATAEWDTPAKQQGETSAQVAAVRAVAQSKGREQGKKR